MAKSKNTVEARQQNQKLEKEARYNAARKKLMPLPWIVVGLLVVSLLLNFMHWTDIYNTGIPGTEVVVNGWAYAFAGITRDFMSTSRIYNDLAVPFYYYAQTWCETLATLTLAAVAVMAVAVVCQVIASAAKLYAMNAVTAVLSAAGGGLLIACYAIALSMKDSQILPIYCSGNPACSIRSFAILPALVAIAAGVFCVVIFVKSQKTKQLLK